MAPDLIREVKLSVRTESISSTPVQKRLLLTVIHAERDAINDRDVSGCSLYVTRYPCADCARLIAEKAIKRVVFVEVNPSNPGVEILRSANIPCTQIPFESLDIPQLGERRPV